MYVYAGIKGAGFVPAVRSVGCTMYFGICLLTFFLGFCDSSLRYKCCRWRSLNSTKKVIELLCFNNFCMFLWMLL